jgi:hypothetical protein
MFLWMNICKSTGRRSTCYRTHQPDMYNHLKVSIIYLKYLEKIENLAIVTLKLSILNEFFLKNFSDNGKHALKKCQVDVDASTEYCIHVYSV